MNMYYCQTLGRPLKKLFVTVVKMFRIGKTLVSNPTYIPLYDDLSQCGTNEIFLGFKEKRGIENKVGCEEKIF